MVQKFRRLILHIGTEKTGSTSIQTFLGRNRNDLLKDGYFIPKTFVPAAWRAQGIFNHLLVAGSALSNIKLLEDLSPLIPVNLEAHRKIRQRQFLEDFQREAECIDKTKCVILSSEHIHSRVSGNEDIVNLKYFLSNIAEKIDVLIYIRPQWEMATSLLGMAIRSGQTMFRSIPNFDGSNGYDRVLGVQKRYFDIARTIANFEIIFGENNITVKNLYSKENRGNVVDDFCEVLAIDGTRYSRDVRDNVNPSFVSLTAILAMNIARSKDGFRLSAENREKFIDLVCRSFPGPGIGMLSHERAQFMTDFEAGNSYIHKKYFPNQRELFVVSPKAVIPIENFETGIAESYILFAEIISKILLSSTKADPRPFFSKDISRDGFVIFGNSMQFDCDQYNEWINFTLPSHVEKVHIISKIGRSQNDSDGRDLGVCVGGLSVDGTSIEMDNDVFDSGFYPIEGAGSQAWRWTNGFGTLKFPESRTVREIKIFLYDWHNTLVF